MLKICEYCENEFYAKHPKNKCCSPICGARLYHNWPKPKEIGENKRYCPKCMKILNEDLFYNARTEHGRLIKWCSICNKKHVNKSTRMYKNEVVEYMGGKCSICGYNKCIHALDIHHISPDKKDPNFKKMRTILTEELKEELRDCILICSNCHRELHTRDSIL